MNHASEFPELMRKLPIDRHRNVPIPAVTARHPDGEPDFSTVDGREAFRLASEGRCGICAQPFAEEVAFLGGPGAAAVGAYHDPPMHEGCAEASTRLCPHLKVREFAIFERYLTVNPALDSVGGRMNGMGSCNVLLGLRRDHDLADLVREAEQRGGQPASVQPG